MELSKWMPWPRSPSLGSACGPVVTVHDPLDLLFSELLSGLDLSRAPRQAPTCAVPMPRVTLRETGSDIEVEVELPGLSEDQIEVTLAEDRLVISGKSSGQDGSTEPQAGAKGLARYAASFRREIPLHWEIARDQVEAVLDKGVLSVRLPKAPPPADQTRQITVKKG